MVGSARRPRAVCAPPSASRERFGEEIILAPRTSMRDHFMRYSRLSLQHHSSHHHTRTQTSTSKSRKLLGAHCTLHAAVRGSLPVPKSPRQKAPAREEQHRHARDTMSLRTVERITAAPSHCQSTAICAPRSFGSRCPHAHAKSLLSLQVQHNTPFFRASTTSTTQLLYSSTTHDTPPHIATSATAHLPPWRGNHNQRIWPSWPSVCETRSAATTLLHRKRPNRCFARQSRLQISTTT